MKNTKHCLITATLKSTYSTQQMWSTQLSTIFSNSSILINIKRFKWFAWSNKLTTLAEKNLGMKNHASVCSLPDFSLCLYGSHFTVQFHHTRGVTRNQTFSLLLYISDVNTDVLFFCIWPLMWRHSCTTCNWDWNGLVQKWHVLNTFASSFILHDLHVYISTILKDISTFIKHRGDWTTVQQQQTWQ